MTKSDLIITLSELIGRGSADLDQLEVALASSGIDLQEVLPYLLRYGYIYKNADRYVADYRSAARRDMLRASGGPS